MSQAWRPPSWSGRAAALALAAALYLAARLPQLPADERVSLAARFHFTRAELPLPPTSRPRVERRVRAVHPSLAHVAGWVSSVGAGVALADLDQDGLPNDLCYVDPRHDLVVVTPAPTGRSRYQPFALPIDRQPYAAGSVAPTGCLPVDLDEDGRLDLLVYFWGRPPVGFLRRGAAALSREQFEPREIVAAGERWYTNAGVAADFDGDGHLDLLLGNYFADGARILDAAAPAEPAEQLQDSMSRALNGGRNRLLLCNPAPGGATVACREAEGWAPESTLRGWTLAVGAADLDGDLLPEIYFANDFGPDRLLHNRSSAGHPRFAILEGDAEFTVPRSKALGRDSFKGMGVDFGDVNGDGALDIYVSNIASDYALHESHFLFLATGDLAAMAEGRAPFEDRSEPLGLSRSGWAWEARLADLDNDGRLEALQATGFMRGDVDRWPELHELAMGNDTLLSRPGAWPRFLPGDDLSGRQGTALFVRDRRGIFFDLAAEVGLRRGEVTRGIATADVDGDGDIDFAVGNQWEPSALYVNDGAPQRRFLGLRVCLPPTGASSALTRIHDGASLPGVPCRPAIGAAVRLRRATNAMPDAALLMQVDGGNGHSGKRSPDLHFGLGPGDGAEALVVDLRWRDGQGYARADELRLRPGWHTIFLGSGAAGS